MSVTRKEWPALLALPDELDDGDAATELQDLLAQDAKHHVRSPLAEAAWAVGTAPSLMVALELLEAWSPAEEAKHPRWPKGTPGGLAGKFMKTGQRFSIKGVEYDVAFTAPGGVFAHVATKGNIGAAQTVFIPAAKAVEAGTGHTILAGVARPKVDVEGYKNAAHHQTSQVKATVIDPYVLADHDSSIPVPADAPPGMTAERWARFGRADQLRYVDLMHQFGKWGDSKAQTLVNAELAKKPHDLVAFVKAAYQSQFGSSSGFSIGLLQTFSKWFQGGHSPTEAQLEADRKKYEEAKQTQDAAARVIQWDLFNRVKAPDISVFHKSGDSVATWKSKWLGKEPIFSGLSETQRYKSGGFGHIAVASPVAIRNIVMATTSADIVSHGFQGEQEVSIGEPMRFDATHTLVFNDSDLSSAQQSWLTHQTQNGTDGSIIEILRQNIEYGVPLPSLPEPANLSMHGEGQQWVAPPAAAKAGIEKLGYADVDSGGVPIAKPANQLELKPGDYIEGMKGTRYIVIADPGSSFGVRYYKLTDPGTATGAMKPYTLGPIHDDTTGNQAYTGHHPFVGVESYDFQTELPFKKLAGHFDLTPSTTTAGGTQFVAGAWAQSGDQKFVKDLGVGGKFYYDGVPYEVEQVIGPKQVEVKSLASGKSGQINGVYKTNYLKLKEGYSEQGVPVFDPADFFEGAPAKLSELDLHEGDLFMAGQAGHLVWKVVSMHEGNAPMEVVEVVGPDLGKKNIMATGLVGRKLTPKPPGWTPAEVGDTFAYQGQKATVTKLLKGGLVQANLAPGVVKLKPDDAALAGLFGASKHELGPKMKVKDMTPGQKFHGGTGGAIRPYVVVEMGLKKLQASGTFAKVRNLDDGEETLVGYQKSYKLLIPKGFAVSAETKHAHEEGAGEVYNPAAWKPSETKIEIAQLKVGDKFLFPIGDQPMEITGDKGAAWEAKNLMTGAATPMLKSGMEVAPLVPSNVMPTVAFDPAQYTVGEEKKLADLQVGDIFKGTKGGKFYLVTKTGAKSGLSAVDLTTGKGSSPWAYTKVAPVMEQKAKGLKKHDDLVPGDAAILAQLAVGDQFTVDGQLHQVVEEAKSKTKNGTVAAVLPGGGLGFPGKVGYYPELLVTFHATKADAEAAAAKSEAEKVALTSVDTIDPGDQFFDGGESATDLEGLGWFHHEPFSPKSKTGGGYFFTKAKHAAEGQVLVGKDGHKVLVKVAGADPVVSDGSGHWFLSGESNMKILDEPFDDHAPALTQSQDAVASQAAAVAPPPPVEHVSSDAVWAMAGADPTTLEGFTKNTAAHNVSTLVPGQMFTSPSAQPGKPNTVWQVTAPPGAGGMVPVKIVASGVVPSTLIGQTTDVHPGFVFGHSTPLAPPVFTNDFPNPSQAAQLANMGGVADAVVQADLGDQWTKNDLVKLPAKMLVPGQLYKTADGNAWLWHGPSSGNADFGFAELAKKEPGNVGEVGSIYPVAMNYAPVEVGPTVDFHAEDWEPAQGPHAKKLMSTVQPGEVISFEDGKPLKVIDRNAAKMTLVVAPTMPLSQKGQGTAHSLTIKAGVQTQLWQPTATEGYKGYIATNIVAPPHPLDSFNSWKDGVKVGDLKPGDRFAQGSGDSYAIFEVTGPPTSFEQVPWKVVATGATTGFSVGDEGSFATTLAPDWYKLAAGQAPEFAPTSPHGDVPVGTPGFSHVDRDVAQAIYAAIANDDEDAYFAAEMVALQHLGMTGTEDGDAEKLSQWLKEVSAQFGLVEPDHPGDFAMSDAAGGKSATKAMELEKGDVIEYDGAEWVVSGIFGGEVHITTLPSSGDTSTTLADDETAFVKTGHIDGYLRTPVSQLEVGDEFEDASHDKWEVTVKDSDGVIAVPIGGMGEDSAAFPDDESVTIITKMADFKAQSSGYYDTSTGNLKVGTTFEDDLGTKWVVTSTDEFSTTAEPIGQEGQGLEKDFLPPDSPHLDGEGSYPDEMVHVLSAPTPPQVSKGDKVLIDGKPHTVYEVLPAGVTVTDDATDEMMMVPPSHISAVLSSPNPEIEVSSMKKGDLVQVHPSEWSDGETPAVWEVTGKDSTGGVTMKLVKQGITNDGESMSMQVGADNYVDKSSWQKWSHVGYANDVSVAKKDHPKALAKLGAEVGDKVWNLESQPPYTVTAKHADGEYELTSPDGKKMTVPAHWQSAGGMIEKAPPIPGTHPLKPYSAKSKSGGGYQFANLNQLKSGDQFTDKTGKLYIHKGMTPDGYLAKFVPSSHLNDPPFFHPGAGRVKVIKIV